jgi:glycosyltransferase involved in cell wall biosynthesis
VTHVRDIMGLSRARRGRLGELRAVIAVSDAVARWLRESGIREERVARIYNAVDVEALRQASRTGAFRRELGFARDVPLVGCVGQIALRKGQDVFLEAASSLAGTFPDARFVIAGARYSMKAESREYEAALRARAAGPALAGKVHLLGFRDDVPSLLRALDVLVVASRQEPLSRVLLEALALGVPAVATDVGGTREILGDGCGSLVVPPGDPAAIAEAVGRLLAAPELRDRLSRAGPDRARRFSPSRQAEAIRALYERVLESDS